MVIVRILVIEDEAKTAKFLQKGLGEAGFVVDVAGDGLDGLHLAQELQFDLVILDVMLPGHDGFEILATLRKRGEDLTPDYDRVFELFPRVHERLKQLAGVDLE